MAQKRTLASYAMANLEAQDEGKLRAMVRGSKATSIIWAWAFAAHQLDPGHWPTQAEYAAYWKISERTAQREWELVKQAFPGETSPERLARWMLSELRNRIADQSAALTVEAPPALTAA